MSTSRLRSASPGFGLGLRTPHYADFLAGRQRVDWLEIITDNFLVDGGKPLAMLDRFRRDYPIAMHGVAMSLGAPGEVDELYLRKVKALADRVQPLWVSDHLCWIGPGPQQLHDLYPLPYTDEAARRIVHAVRRAQDILQRRLVLENVSSYVAFNESACSEWQFLSHVASEADCLLLVDVNNIHVSCVNHGLDPLEYLAGLPADRVQQIHLAGHTDQGDCIVDTHDEPVVDAVWELYRVACDRFGQVATMIERDDRIPPLAELVRELDHARAIAARAQVHDRPGQRHVAPASTLAANRNPAAPDALSTLQRDWTDYILEVEHPLTMPLAARIETRHGIDPRRRLSIYHQAYRSRLTDVLADSFNRTERYMGSETFAAEAQAHAVGEPPRGRSLNGYGAGFPAHLRQRFPDNPELYELAQLDWDLRACFDGADIAVLDADSAAADPQQSWLSRIAPLHPSVRLRTITTNAVALWKALDADVEVPPPLALAQPLTLAVWRLGLQPQFKTLERGQDVFITCLARGRSILQACDELQAEPELSRPETLGGWLRAWWEEGLLRADPATS